jgi:hypothetical protein
MDEGVGAMTALIASTAAVDALRQPDDLLGVRADH